MFWLLAAAYVGYQAGKPAQPITIVQQSPVTVVIKSKPVKVPMVVVTDGKVNSWVRVTPTPDK